jgi:two-component system nitrogen regulation response regulator GlnG
MLKVLVVEDHCETRQVLRNALYGPFRVALAGNAAAALDWARRQPFDGALLDVRLPDSRGDELLRALRRLDPHLAAVLLTGFPTPELAIQALRGGAYKVLAKPPRLAQVRATLQEAIAAAQEQRLQALQPAAPPDGLDAALVGFSEPMQPVYEAIARLADDAVPVLLEGETGTGKELVARALHAYGCRKDRPFLPVNCAALPPTLAESALFGHEKGTFTGADGRRLGYFEQADGGTLFLDEINALPAELQPKLLRVLQEQRFQRLGGTEVVQTAARVVAASNQNLRALSAAGKFREDLYYRLAVWPIRLPPLRERGEDLPELVDALVRELCGRRNRTRLAVAPDVLERLRAYPWPGNVRELRNELERAVLMTPVGVLKVECLPDDVREGRVLQEEPPRDLRPPVAHPPLRELVRQRLQEGGERPYRKVLAEVDHVAVEEALALAGGSEHKASELLGMSRTTFRTKCQALQEPPAPRAAPTEGAPAPAEGSEGQQLSGSEGDP